MYEKIKQKGKQALVGILGATLIGMGLGGCVGVDPEVYRVEETAVVEQIQAQSPYNPEYARINIQKSNSRKWYSNYNFAPYSETQILVEGRTSIMLGNKDDKDSLEVIVTNTQVRDEYLWGVNGDVFWVDYDNMLNKAYQEDDGWQTEQIMDLGEYFTKVRGLFDVGYINEDDLIDMVYLGTVQVAGLNRNAIYVGYGSEDGLEPANPIIYLNRMSIRELFVGDYDLDGDSDIALMDSGNTKQILGYQNLTIPNGPFGVNDHDLFQKELREIAQEDFSDAMFWIAIMVLIMD